MKIHPLVVLLAACAASIGLIALASAQLPEDASHRVTARDRLVPAPWNDAGDPVNQAVTHQRKGTGDTA